MKRTVVFLILSALTVATVVGFEGSARAQTAPPPAVSAGGSGGAGIGVGASAFVSGLTGAQIVYDAARFHIEGLVAFTTSHNGNQNANAPRVTEFDFGVSAWYHLHLGANSDFSLGGGFGLLTENGGGLSNVTEIVEPGAQIRAFVTPNVAIHALIALPLVFGDTTMAANQVRVFSNVSFTGQILAGFGFTYFFR